MKFGLLYELEMPRPRDADGFGSEADPSVLPPRLEPIREARGAEPHLRLLRVRRDLHIPAAHRERRREVVDEVVAGSESGGRADREQQNKAQQE